MVAVGSKDDGRPEFLSQGESCSEFTRSDARAWVVGAHWAWQGTRSAGDATEHDAFYSCIEEHAVPAQRVKGRKRRGIWLPSMSVATVKH